MRKDPQFAEYFDDQGNLNRDISGLCDDGNSRIGLFKKLLRKR